MDTNSRKDQNNQFETHQKPAESGISEPPIEEQRSSREELLAEIRQSLREDETQKREPGIIQRFKSWLGGSFKRKPKASKMDAPKVPESLSASAFEVSALDTELIETVAHEIPEPEVPIETESPNEKVKVVGHPLAQTIDANTDETPEVEQVIEEPPLTRMVSRKLLSEPRDIEASAGNYKDIRDVALQDYDEAAPMMPASEPSVSLRQSARRALRDMHPSEKRMLIGASVLIVLFVMFAGGFFVISSLPKPSPTVTPTASGVPYPISINLPGGWTFPLNEGTVQNGKWNPAGPEWLDGTEVCRWVSLPYSVQLEAVLRTLKLDDQIGLSMSNYDYLVYKTKSIQQVSVNQISQLNSQTPCLLVILANEKSDKRWVVTAIP